MIYLRKFETQAAYTAAQSSLILPNVSLITENNKVEYNPYVPPTPSHEYVDLGLPSGTKWATMNVGASSVTDYGNHYSYGKGAAIYQETSGGTPYDGEENPLAASADTATQVWGGSWHMPTQTQFNELTANTTYEWTTINGVNGGKFTAQNGNYVFFPASGLYDYGDYSPALVGEHGSYWTSTPGDGDAYHFDFSEYGFSIDYSYNINGRSIRPVMDD